MGKFLLNNTLITHARRQLFSQRKTYSAVVGGNFVLLDHN
jgi:hypothetical protein